MPDPSSSVSAIRSPLLRTIVEAGANSSLVEAMLREQQSLTAVDRFSRKHDEGHGGDTSGAGCQVPAQSKYYRDLIPLDRPKPGQQYAFEVDLDVCTGCKACVAACHSLNGLDGPEVWRTVGLLHGGTTAEPQQQTVTTSCHHCVDPACLNGCPVQAYEKDPVTGIVKHLDDQCIGCQYCTLMCPYDAPKYSPERGIVRKCDMCTDRLAADEAPACVQGCPNQAIKIKVVDQIFALQASQAGTFLPGAPTPDHTVPTTIYKTSKPAAANLLPADFYTVSTEHSHPPLIVLLVFTQLAVGAFTSLFASKMFLTLPTAGSWALAHAGFSLFLGLFALGASVFHLGRPQGAWRVFLGLRTSWMSREAIGFGVFAKLGVLYAGSVAAAQSWPAFPGRGLVVAAAPILEGMTALVGIAGVFFSVMIYVATRRTQWRGTITAVKFFGTTFLLGPATVLAVAQLVSGSLPAATRTAVMGDLTRGLFGVVLAVAVTKLVFELALLRHARADRHSILKRVAVVMLRDLARSTGWRFGGLAIGGIVIPLLALSGAAGPGALKVLAPVALVLLAVGEFCERYQFFKSAPPSRMPGALG
jgi:formate dehydrogenase iron-sulfur subunit